MYEKVVGTEEYKKNKQKQHLKMQNFGKWYRDSHQRDIINLQAEENCLIH